MVDFTERHTIPEWINEPDSDVHTLYRTLDEQHLIIEWFGGYVVSMNGIRGLLPRHIESCRIMDIGCGGGELSRPLHRWAKRKKINLNYIGIDPNPNIIQYARQKHQQKTNTEFCCESVFELKNQNCVDIVHASLCLHQFHQYQAVKALKKMYDLCVYGVIINDLHRHPFAYHTIKTLTALGSRSEIIRHDSPAAVLNSFKQHELYDLASKAGVPCPLISWHWAFRWLMIIPKKSQVKVKQAVLHPEMAVTKTV